MSGDIFKGYSAAPSLSSKIFNKLRDDILDGKYRHGEKLTEVKLAKELGVSRTPIREALKQLELEGLVDNIPNRGVVVKGISKRDMNDILSIRSAVEGIAAEWAIERMDKGITKELKEICDLMEFYTMKKDYEKILELNTEFHDTIYRATKSRYLEHMLKDFQQYIKGIRQNSLRTPGRLESALEEHTQIVEAFEEKNIKKAKRILEKHIGTLKGNI